MILKTFEIKKKKILGKFLLFHGNNQGFKDDIINEVILENFDGEILRYEETEVIINQDNFISNLKNDSLFAKKKIIIINRVTDKMFSFISNIATVSLKDTVVVLVSGILEKKSKIRQLFEKDVNLFSTPFYEDDSRTLQNITYNLLKKDKIKISPESINLLIERAQGDRKNIKNEVSKLKILFATKKKIEIEDIAKLTNIAENYSVFELVENYLVKNKTKVSKILNENNYTNDDCILILRTILNRAKRLLKLKDSHNITGNIDLTISSYKPPIFWKEKEAVKKQIQTWSIIEIKKMLYKINDLEILIKKNSMNSLNFISDFVRNY